MTAWMPLDMKDAWIAASRLPSFFRRLLGEGGLSVSFIPIYLGIAPDDQATRRALVNGVFGLLLAITGSICLIVLMFAEPIVGMWLSGAGFSAVPGKIAMTVTMARIMVFFLFFVTQFAFFMALLNSHKKFTLSGYAPLFLNLSVIASLYFFRDTDSLVFFSALALPIGGFLQAAFLLPSLVQVRGWPVPSFHFFHPLVKKVIIRFLPTFLGVGVLQVLGLINTYFASQLTPGTVFYIYLGDRLLELPLSLIAVSIGTTLLPQLTSYWREGDQSFFVSSLFRHMSLFYFLAIPCSVGLWLLGSDMVDILFKRGEFRPDEVPVVAGILQVYAFTLLAAGSLKILNQAIYAMGDTLTPALISIFGLVVHILLAPRLMALYQVQGLVASTAAITLINLMVGGWVLSRRLSDFPVSILIQNVSRCFAAATALAAYLYGLQYIPWRQNSFLLDFPLLLILIAVGAMIYFAAASLMGVEELSSLVARFRKRKKS